MSLVKEINHSATRPQELSAIKQIPSRVALHTQQGISLIPWRNILFCQADSNYTHIHLMDGSQLMISKTLNHICSRLPTNSFFRIHQSNLVNVNAIVEVCATNVRLSDGTVLSVSRGKRKPLLDKIYQISIKI